MTIIPEKYREYYKFREHIGYKKFNAVVDYLKELFPQEVIDSYQREGRMCRSDNPEIRKRFQEELNKKYGIITLDDIMKDKNEYKKFDEWYKNKQIKNKSKVR